ncbi:putative ABC transport system permease protein [Desulfovibrionales bacterium]
MIEFIDLLRISLRQVLRQHKCYLGVILSIAFGTAGFILILTMGDEVKCSLNRDLDLLGGATVVKAFFRFSHNQRDWIRRPPWFYETTNAALRTILGVEYITAITMYNGVAIQGKSTYKFALFGVDEHFWEVNSVTPKTGSFFGVKEIKERTRVLVLGKELAKKIYGIDKNPVGELLSLNDALYQVTGTLDAVSSKRLSDFAYIPITTQSDQVANLQPTRIHLRCRSLNDVESVANTIPCIVIAHQPAEDLHVEVAWGQLRYIKCVVWLVELFIYFSVSATLILGGFGIWNGIMSAVKARTREIGLKKAMGADELDIMLQFLSESISLSLTAAIIGILLGLSCVAVAVTLLKSELPYMQLITYSGMAVVFALVLGIGAGFYPSLRASRMEVVAAIRYE